MTGRLRERGKRTVEDRRPAFFTTPGELMGNERKASHIFDTVAVLAHGGSRRVQECHSRDILGVVAMIDIDGFPP